MANALTFDEFKKLYIATFRQMMSYTPKQVGMMTYCEKLAELAEAYPEWAELVEADREV